MGRTKLYSEQENNPNKKQQRTTSAPSRINRAAMSPGRLVYDAPEPLPMSDILRRMLLRVRRNWIAIRFQLNRYTFGLFHKQGLLKLAFVGGAAYVLLIYNPESFAVQEEIPGLAVETSLGIGSYHKAEKPAKKKPKNEAAPISVQELGGESSEYIDRYSKIAREEMRKFGVPASISLAQGLIESRAGSSKLAKTNNNHFGMKCFSRKCKKGHCSNFTDDTHKDFFRIFENPWDSWRAHSQMISTGRYAKLKKYGHDYRKWANGLKSVGYATDRNYAEKLIGVIEKYNLNRFDH
jgi:flagellum-specific peptidoglycan hydrolase FlgJ